MHLRGAGYRLSRDHRAQERSLHPRCSVTKACRNGAANVEPDTTLLFRYSALTFNGHRIHYDRTYAREQEGYPDLVVHGPLTATLLQQLALDHGAGRALARFDFRGVTPLFVGRAFQLEGRQAEDGTLALWARGPEGELAMSATASFR